MIKILLFSGLGFPFDRSRLVLALYWPVFFEVRLGVGESPLTV